MKKTEIIPSIDINFENLDVDLKERLKNIIAGIQKISSKIAINRISMNLFAKQGVLKNLYNELADVMGVDEIVLWNFSPEQFCFAVRLPTSLLGHYPTYHINDTIIFATFNQAFYFSADIMERDEQEGHNERLVFHPEFITWEDAIRYIQNQIKYLQDEIPENTEA